VGVREGYRITKAITREIEMGCLDIHQKSACFRSCFGYHVSNYALKRLTMIHEVVNNKLDGFSNNKLLVLDFYADWCNPCQALAPVLDKIANDNQDITFLRINVDNNQDLSDKYNILSIPTLILINDGRVIETSIGVISENVLQNKLDLMKQA